MSWVVLFVMIAVLLSTSHAALVRFYVSPQGNDSWSGRLVRPNAQRTDGPFATLHRAQQAVRELKARGLRQPIEVVVGSGIYYLHEPLVFTPDDSGTADAPITYRAAKGATVVLSGGVPLSGWRRVRDNLWSVPVPDSVKSGEVPRLLRLGDRWAIRVRHPNFDPRNPRTGGWLFADFHGETPQSAGSREYLMFREGDIPHWRDISGAELHIFPAWGWVNAIAPSVRIDYDARKVHLPPDGYTDDIRPGNRYFVEGVRDALDAPHEWYLDREKGELLYLSEGDTPPAKPAVLVRLDRLIVLKGEPEHNRWIEHLRFEGFTFVDTNYTLTTNYYMPADAVIWMSGARDCVVSGCTFRWTGGYALRLEERSERVQFVKNRVEDVGQGGVILVGDNASQPRHNLIAGNIMQRLGLVYKHVAGVYVITGSDNRIAHNTIWDTPRYAISLKTLDPTRQSHRNIVEYNDLRRTNLETNDTGAIETLGRDQQDTGNIIRYNLILDSVGMVSTPEGKIVTPYFTWGIYLDDYSSGTTVFGNIVARTVNGGICVHGGKNNLFENNIFVDASVEQIRLQPRDDFMQGNRFVRNIVVYSKPESTLIFSWDNRRDRFAEWDYNLYWLRGADLRGINRRITPLGTFEEWLKAGFDAHSLVADPLFVAPEKDDYRLRRDSPAWKLGFRAIPVEKIGYRGWRGENRIRQ